MATVSQEADLDKEAQAVDMVTASKRTPAVTILGESTLVLAIRAAWVEFRPLTVELRRTTMDTTKRPLGLLVKTRLPAVVLVLLHTVGLSTLRQKVRNASSTLSRDLSWKCTALSLPVPSYFTAESRRKNVACLLFLNSSVAYFLLSQSFSHLLVLVNSHARFLALSSFAGYVYYYNSRTGISQWERPMELDFPLSK
jgi:hypothetical protein